MLSNSAMNFIISNEDAMIEETIVSPVDTPSASQPVAPEVVVSTEPVPVVPTDVVVEPTAAPVGEPLDVQMVVDTQNPTDMLGQANQETAVCQERADDLLAMQHACEQYGKLLRQTGLEGVSEEGAAFMQVGMKMIQKSLGTDLVVSKESIDDIHPRSSKVKVTISVESVKELASKAYEAFVAAIHKLIELMKKGWEQLMDLGNNQEKAIDEQLRRVSALKTTDNDEIQINSPSMLFANGDEVFPEIKGISGLAHFALVAYPNAMLSYYAQISKFIHQIPDDDSVSDEEITANLDDISKPLIALATDSAVRGLFNGNYQIDVAHEGLSFGIKAAEGAPAPDTVDLMILPPIKLRKLLNDMLLINTLMRDYRKANERVVRAAEIVLDAAKSMKNLPKLSTDVMTLINKATPRNREIALYISKVLRAYLAVTDRMISAHEGKTEKA